MGLLTYHSLLFKYAENSPAFGQMYYELRSHCGSIMIETNDEDFFHEQHDTVVSGISLPYPL